MKFTVNLVGDRIPDYIDHVFDPVWYFLCSWMWLYMTEGVGKSWPMHMIHVLDPHAKLLQFGKNYHSFRYILHYPDLINRLFPVLLVFHFCFRSTSYLKKSMSDGWTIFPIFHCESFIRQSWGEIMSNQRTFWWRSSCFLYISFLLWSHSNPQHMHPYLISVYLASTWNIWNKCKL